ncbi:MAG: PLP-dependent aminotransferase family protein [Lachnospiraceae bacterium]|nr:PLP-dependent aminotransferase family protein [Lachnospiraceae bacterium]
MLVYDFNHKNDQKLYEYLYECLKKDILSGRIPTRTRLPSKRQMAKDNGISITTVINAYDQLLMEGYILSKEKKGYFVADVKAMEEYRPKPLEFTKIYHEENWFVDFTANNTVYNKFPFSTWKKVIREVLAEYEMELIMRGNFLGEEELRSEIAEYLYRSRGINVSPECIVIGAGIEYLYSRLIKILPSHAVYAVENPGYKKIPRIYEENGLQWRWVEMDENGINMDSLKQSHASVIHVSPEHHYPLGTVMTAIRRQEVLEWVSERPDRYIIEDDYDCEFRYRTKSIPALKGLDRNHRVIYMNTFNKTLAPAIRISYMILPEKLMEKYIQTSNFFSNTVSSLEQYALAKFIQKGYFERHLNRIKKYYRTEGERLLRLIKQSRVLPVVSATGTENGTHLLIKLDTSLTDIEIKWAARNQGINISCLSEFCGEIRPEYQHILVINYSDLDENTLREAVRRLSNIFIQW